MAPLSDLNLQISYRTSAGSIVESFYTPCLERALVYKRAVGYFTSSSLSVAAKGLARFLAGNGKMYLVASPHLSEEDVVAMKMGYKGREAVITTALLRAFVPNAEGILSNRLACLAWLIAENRLEIKIALPLPHTADALPRGLYHEKIGIFSDSMGNKVAFSGSPNETAGGLVQNFESIDVFWSWNDPQNRVSAKELCFNELWENRTPFLEIIDFPEAAKTKLLTYKPKFAPTTDLEETEGKVEPLIFLHDLEFKLRPYQNEAIDSWFGKNFRGIFSMATGTGKTKTALGALRKLRFEGRSFIAVVIVPYMHLAEQWAEECKLFQFKGIICYSENPEWERQVLQLRTSFLTKNLDVAILITTYATFRSDKFQNTLHKISQEKILIADEVHHMGAISNQVSLSHFTKRLGLSATPERIYDKEGSQWLVDNIGPTIFHYGLEKAIGTCLTPYRYYVHTVYLDDDEQQSYQEVMKQISVACMAKFSLSEEDPDANSKIGPLLRKRQEILGGAKGKIPKLREVLQKLGAMASESKVGFSLYYSSSSLFMELAGFLSFQMNLKIAKFTFEETMEERRKILKEFSEKQISGILAKKCLDEGMDIPATRNAFILSSSSNPMEFIQRRGRVLRKFPGKDEAVIHDFFVLPGAAVAVNEYDRKLVERELKRAVEFTKTAKNEAECMEQILPIQKYYNLLHL